MVCERWCVTKMVCKRGCVKDGVWQSGVWKMVCQRWWVTMWCVKDGAWKMVGDKVGCERWCVKDGVWQSGVWKRVCQSWCHACHAKRPWMCNCATPATWNQGECHQVPRLPRETKVDVTKCHACHAKCRGVTGAQASPSAPPSAICPTPATQNDGGCEFVPRLPRETKVDVSLCHACHAKCRGVTGAQASPSAPPRAICPTPATQNDGGCDFVPRLPRETTVDVRLCHACHAKCRGVTGAQASPSAPPSAICPTPATQNDGGCEFVPRLPRETTVDVTKCHACHAKCRGVTGDKSGPSAPHSTMSGTPATQNDGGCEFCATPATWNEGGCHQVPRLPRKVPRRHRRQIRTKRATQYHECHTCHAKRRLMRVLCRACHVKRRWMSPSATPATQSAAASQATNPVPWVARLPRKTTVDASFVPRLPRETTVDVRLCHACHAKWRRSLRMWSLGLLSLCVCVCEIIVC